MIGVVACPEHGALYYQLDVTPGITNRDAAAVKPLDTRLPRPQAGAPLVCPTCGAGLEEYLVADGTLS